MKIKGTEGLSTSEINHELQNGGKFVVYQFCISLLLITFKRSSSIYFIKSGENAVTKGLIFSLISFVLGWWGIPWGPVYTIQTMVNNFKGGKNITQEVINSANGATNNI